MERMWIKLLLLFSVLAAKEVLVQGNMPYYISELVKDIKQLKAQSRGVYFDRNAASPYLDGDEAIMNRRTLEDLKAYYKEQVRQSRGKRSVENGEVEHRNKRAIMDFNRTTLATGKWPGGRIRYAVDPLFSASQKAVIEEAVRWWEENTCITFRDVTQNPDPRQPYVLFTPGTGCVSFVGRTIENIPQPTYLGGDCFQLVGTLAHEIGHTIGFWHTHQLSTRNEYVSVFGRRMVTQNDGEIVDLPPSLINYFNLPYDYASVMHYDPRIFAQPGLRTIETRDPLYQQTIGQRVELSFQDVKVVNMAYCPSCNFRINCQNGGYQDPASCGRCICPDGWSGSLCTTVDRRNGCGGDILVDGRGGSISSPGFDQNQQYPENILCAWRFRNTLNQNIVFEFHTRFGIYCYGDTAFHWVELRINGTLYDTGYRFCGQQRPRNVFVSVNPSKEVMVVFKSNFDSPSSFRRTGFKLEYRLENQVGCMVGGCDNGGTCNMANGACQCADGYRGIRCEFDDRCNRGYCQNGATCTPRPNRAPLCTCRPGFNGPRCQTVVPNNPRPTPAPGDCGACGLPPGQVQVACNSTTETEEYEVRCSSLSSSRFRFFGGRGRHDRRRNRNRWCTAELSKKFCCANAELMRVNDDFLCGVPGWTDWGSCSGGSCGGCGVRRKSEYQVIRRFSRSTCHNDRLVICQVDRSGCNYTPCPPDQCIGNTRVADDDDDDDHHHRSWFGRRKKRGLWEWLFGGGDHGGGGGGGGGQQRDGFCVNQCCVPYSLSSDGSTCSDGSGPPDQDPRRMNPITPSTTRQRNIEPLIYDQTTIPQNVANGWNPFLTPSTIPPRFRGRRTTFPSIYRRRIPNP